MKTDPQRLRTVYAAKSRLEHRRAFFAELPPALKPHIEDLIQTVATNWQRKGRGSRRRQLQLTTTMALATSAPSCR